MKKKLLFFAPPVVLAVITMIWLFHEDNRWYYYRQEWPFEPLLLMHFLFPLLYVIALVVMIVRHINKDKRSSSDVFYIVSSIAMTVVCFVGLVFFLIFTSGV